MLKGLKDDIAMVRSDDLVLQSKLVLADDFNKPREPTNIEAMDIVEPVGPSLAGSVEFTTASGADGPFTDRRFAIARIST